jgi:putative oxidoreductase
MANMLGAIMLVHLRAGFFLPEGVEFALSLLGSAALLAVVGAGGWSVDAVLAGRAAERQPELNRAARGGSRRAA